MPHGDPGPMPAHPFGSTNGHGRALAEAEAPDPAIPGQVIETIVSPFHCLYQDALWLHTQSHLLRPSIRE